MSERKEKKNNQNEKMDPQEGREQDAGAVEVQLVTVEELDALKQQLAEAQTQAVDFKDGWQRARAEFDNYRKRIERENSLVYQNATANVIKRYLPILDDLERAMQARPADLPWAAGIDLIQRKLQSILDSEGIKRIEAEGQIFDPNFHEAISQEQCDELPSGYVVAVVQNGYMLGDKVLRPAMVRVSE
jgi:molecular chaperone GrpE